MPMNNSQEYIVSEDHILEIIEKYFPRSSSASILLDKGDDCTVFAPSIHTNQVFTTDIFAEDRHFRTSYFSPEDIGYKSLAANISDIYAMGAKPVHAQLALFVPKKIKTSYLDTMFQSMALLAREHGISLIGGDISASEKLQLSITLMGEVDKEVKLYRRNAKANDIVYISTGIENLAKARLALEYLEKNNKAKLSKSVLDAHLKPRMYKEEARQIAEFAKKYTKEKFSLMDISDGLARDLPRLVYDYGVELDFDTDKINLDIQEHCRYNKENPLKFILKGGEDYILLGTCPEKQWEEFSRVNKEFTRLGKVIDTKGIFYKEKPINIQGYDHFNHEEK